MGNIPDVMDWVDIEDLDNAPDWNDDGGFELYDAGDYRVRTTGCSPGTSGKGNPKIVVTAEIVSMEDGSETRFAGKQVFLHLPSTGKAAGKLKQYLDAIGEEIKGGFSPKNCLDQEFCLTISHRPFTSKPDADGNSKELMGIDCSRFRPIPAPAKKEKPGHNAKTAQRQAQR